MKYTREQLIKAMQKYNNEVLDNPDGFDELSSDEDCAIEQVDKLISLVE